MPDAVYNAESVMFSLCGRPVAVAGEVMRPTGAEVYMDVASGIGAATVEVRVHSGSGPHRALQRLMTGTVPAPKRRRAKRLANKARKRRRGWR